jgi:hypothetical protein
MKRNMLNPHWPGSRLANTCWDTFCDLLGIGGIWSTHVEIHFFLANMGRICYTHVDMKFLAWELGYTLCPRWHGRGIVNTSCEILCPCRHGWGSVNTCWDAFSILAGMWRVRSTHGEKNFVSSLAWKGLPYNMRSYILWPRCHGICFVHHILRYILCPHWHVTRFNRC